MFRRVLPPAERKNCPTAENVEMKNNSRQRSAITVMLWLPFACLVGYVIGTWGARDELRAYQESVKEERNRSSKNVAGFDTFANMVKIPEMTRRPRKTKSKKASSKSKVAQTTNETVAETSTQSGNVASVTNAAPVQSKKPQHRSVEDLGVRIEEAQELWRTRVEVARAQWKDKLKLSAEKEQAFDAALQEMNERLYDSIAAVADLVAGSETMSPELGLRLVGETTAIMAETYDKIGACVPQEMRSDVSSMQMVDFVDPGVAEPLIGVQGKLEGLRHPPRMNR